MNDKDTLQQIHILIHSLRLITGYKSSEAEKKVGKIIREHYSNECQECKEIEEKIKSAPAPPKGLGSKIKSAITGGE